MVRMNEPTFISYLLEFLILTYTLVTPRQFFVVLDTYIYSSFFLTSSKGTVYQGSSAKNGKFKPMNHSSVCIPGILHFVKFLKTRSLEGPPNNP